MSNITESRSEKISEEEPETKEKHHIHVILRPKRYSKFVQLKESIDANSDVDVIRYCIDETFKNKDKEKIDIRPILLHRAELLLNNDFFKNKYLVSDFNQILNEALHQWIQKKNQEINLHSIPFREELSPEEHKVALTFVEHQIDFDRGITFEDLLDLMPDIKEQKLRQILKKFLMNELLFKTSFQGIDYYYAPLP